MCRKRNALINPILIVDDEPSNLAILRQILAPDYPLVFARSGAGALQMVAKHKPALILLDVRMGDMDGFAVCHRLKNDPETEDIPVVFVTDLLTIADEAAGFNVGAVDYITKPVSPHIVRARIRAHLSQVSAKQLEKSHRDAIRMLAEASEFRDADMGAHIWRVAAYSSALAAASGWQVADYQQLELAASMHDIGKIGIPDQVLLKPGVLDEAEALIMRTHTTIGYNILSKSTAPIFQVAATIALHHHEKWDGSGYPVGLSGEAIPEVARIVALADVFDALSMARPYKRPWPLERIMENLTSNAGYHFESRLVDNFVRILPEILAIRDNWDADAPTMGALP